MWGAKEKEYMLVVDVDLQKRGEKVQTLLLLVHHNLDRLNRYCIRLCEWLCRIHHHHHAPTDYIILKAMPALIGDSKCLFRGE